MEMLWNFTDLNNFEKIKISDTDLLATIWSIILIFVGVTGNLSTYTLGNSICQMEK